MEVRIAAGPVDAVPLSASYSSSALSHVLVVSKNEQACRIIRSVLQDPEWLVTFARGTTAAAELLEQHEFAAVLCDRDLSPDAWIELLTEAATRSCPPGVIVFSRLADNTLWAEVLNLGGYDLLMYPFEPEELTRVTQLACEKWHREALARRSAATAARKTVGQEQRPALRAAAAGD